MNAEAHPAELLGVMFGLAVGLGLLIWLLPITLCKIAEKRNQPFPSVGKLRLLLVTVMLAALIYGIVSQ